MSKICVLSSSLEEYQYLYGSFDGGMMLCPATPTRTPLYYSELVAQRFRQMNGIICKIQNRELSSGDHILLLDLAHTTLPMLKHAIEWMGVNIKLHAIVNYPYNHISISGWSKTAELSVYQALHHVYFSDAHGIEQFALSHCNGSYADDWRDSQLLSGKIVYNPKGYTGAIDLIRTTYMEKTH